MSDGTFTRGSSAPAGRSGRPCGFRTLGGVRPTEAPGGPPMIEGRCPKAAPKSTLLEESRPPDEDRNPERDWAWEGRSVGQTSHHEQSQKERTSTHKHSPADELAGTRDSPGRVVPHDLLGITPTGKSEDHGGTVGEADRLSECGAKRLVQTIYPVFVASICQGSRPDDTFNSECGRCPSRSGRLL